jgi:hypothetical protein
MQMTRTSLNYMALTDVKQEKCRNAARRLHGKFQKGVHIFHLHCIIGITASMEDDIAAFGFETEI